MRAILINAYDQKVEEIDLPLFFIDFQKKVEEYLKCKMFSLINSNEILEVLLDPGAYNQPNSPAFFSPLSEGFPIFGNAICVGRNPLTGEMDNLFEEYKIENFNIRWCTNDELVKHRTTAKIDYSIFAQKVDLGKHGSFGEDMN